MRILFILTRDDYVRNYFNSGVIERLSREHTVLLGAEESLELLDELRSSPAYVGAFATSSEMDARHRLLFQLYMWRFRSRSKTFFYRWQGMAKWSLLLPTKSKTERLLNIIRWLRHVTSEKKVWRIPLLGNRLVFPFASRWIKSRLQIPDGLAKLVENSSPDLIVFPSSGYESSAIDLIRLGRVGGIPSLCLVDNWDNLTSKTVFWEKPDFLGVWGRQIREQAIRIHEFDPETVFEIGSPRFEAYFLRPSDRSQNPTPTPYILFVGSAMAFDELAALRLLENHLEDSGICPQDIRIMYRPHPWQQPRRCDARFEPTKYQYSFLDPQMEALFPDGAWPSHSNTLVQPALDYYPSLLRGAKVVVGPLTTMLLEAALCLRPVVGLGYSDRLHFNTARRYFSHFDQTHTIPGFFMCEEETALGPMVSAAMDLEPLPRRESELATNYFVTHSAESTYHDRLARTIQQISRAHTHER